MARLGHTHTHTHLFPGSQRTPKPSPLGLGPLPGFLGGREYSQYLPLIRRGERPGKATAYWRAVIKFGPLAQPNPAQGTDTGEQVSSPAACHWIQESLPGADSASPQRYPQKQCQDPTPQPSPQGWNLDLRPSI